MPGYRAHRRKISKLMGLDYLWFGLFGQFMGVVLMTAGPSEPTSAPVLAGELALVLSTGVLIGGCAMYGRFHGLNRFLAFLGLLSVPGVLILMLLTLRGRERKQGPGFSVIFAEPYRRDVWRMDVRVKLDENLAAGVREPIMLQLPRGASIGTAMKTLAGVIPDLMNGDLPNTDFIVNGLRADRRSELSNGDELIVNLIGKSTSGSF